MFWGGLMSKETIETHDISAIVAKHSEEMSSYGIKCTITQKHFQLRNSYEPHTNSGAGVLLSLLDRVIYKLRLKYLPFKDDDYTCIVIRFEPISSSIKKSEIKEYAFIKNYRRDINKKRDKSRYIPQKTEKLIKKIIKRLKKSSADKVCKDTIFDIIRYTTQVKYSYKKHILGYDKNILEAMTAGLILLLVLLCAIIMFFV